MTEQEQQIALCEWAGWTDLQLSRSCLEGESTPLHWFGRQPGKPNSLVAVSWAANSLDVLHSMEVRLIESIPTNQYGKTGLEVYSDALKRVIEDTDHVPSAITARYMTAIAKPEQRRQAILEVLKLWKP